MDNINDKTSFVPHEQVVKSGSSFGNFFFKLSIFTFIASLVFAVFAYFMRVQTISSYAAYQTSFNKAKERLNSGLPIETVTEFNSRLDVASMLLSEHKSLTPVFNLLEKITLTNVQFTSFSYKEVGNSGKNVVTLQGRAPNYKTVAEQSEQFSQNQEAKRYFTGLVFTNLDFGPKEKRNDVNFEVTFSVEPELLEYSRTVADTGTNNTDTNSATNIENTFNRRVIQTQ